MYVIVSILLPIYYRVAENIFKPNLARFNSRLNLRLGMRWNTRGTRRALRSTKGEESRGRRYSAEDFPTSESSRTSCSHEQSGRGHVGQRRGQASARNRSLTAVLHALPFLPSRPGDGYRARHATPRRATPSYGPPGVPGHSGGNRSASVARGTR